MPKVAEKELLATEASSSTSLYTVASAPWQTWTIADTLNDPELELAEYLISVGDLKQALVAYKKLEDTSADQNIRDESFIRRLGTELKFGNSKDALQELARFAQARKIELNALNPRLALIAAFCYLQQNQLDQSLAWFKVAYKNFPDYSPESEKTKAEALRVIASIPNEYLNEYLGRWSSETTIFTWFNEEKMRRDQGGSLGKRFEKNWFRTETYSANREEAERSANDLSQLEEAYAPPTIPAADQFILGLLLPFSGQFSEHAERVRRGVELAIEAEGGVTPPKLVQADTQVNAEKAASEYERLTKQEGAKVVIGPMEVKGTETVATKSSEIRVPFISFTKKAGIPGLSSVLFRLGVTADNQVEELVNYAVDVLHLSRLSMVYPDNDAGHEYAVAFQDYLSQRGVELVKMANYQANQPQRIEQALIDLGSDVGEGLFVADSLENARPIIVALRTKGVKATLLGPALWNDSTAIRGLGYLIDGAVYVTPYYTWSLQPNVQDFKQRFKTKYNADPDVLSAQAYDATTLIFRAAFGRSTDPKVITEMIHSYGQYRGVTGELVITPSGEIRRRMTVVQIQDGSTSEVMVAGELIGVLPNAQDQENKNSSQNPIQGEEPAKSEETGNSGGFAQ